MATNDNILAAASAETEPGALSQAATTDNDILIALNKLDPANEDHWTSTGKPAMDAVNALLPAPITRARLDEVAPDFSRPEAPSSGDAGDGAVGSDGAGDVGGDEQPTPDVSDKTAQVSVEGRVSDLEADIAFLRKQFGWPTKGT